VCGRWAELARRICMYVRTRLTFKRKRTETRFAAPLAAPMQSHITQPEPGAPRACGGATASAGFMSILLLYSYYS